MIGGRRILAVIPARGGSKGIALKNLQPVAGKTLVTRAAEFAASLPWVDRAVVSTDHLLIRQAAIDAGVEAPFMRPPELSGDRIGDVEVLSHALLATEADDGSRYDVVLMLQPTSPLRDAAAVRATAERLVAEELDAVWTVSPTDSKAHPLKQLVIDEQGRLGYYDPAGAAIVARQQLEPVYHRNGVAYAVTRQTLLEAGSLLGERAAAVVVNSPQVSIDTMEDLERAAGLLQTADGEDDHEPSRVRPPRVRPRRLVVDIDGVIAAARSDLDYATAAPITENIRRINALHDAGCEIVLFTARGSVSGEDWSARTAAQMQTWGVRYHELRFGKPAADFYVDDRMISLPQAMVLCGLAEPDS